MLPFGTGDKMRDYFDKYQSSQHHLDASSSRCTRARTSCGTTTRRSSRRSNLWATSGRLRQYLYMAQQLDASSWQRIAQIEAHRPDAGQGPARGPPVLRPPEGPGPATQLAVSVQGYLALDLVRKNNLELIKGVDRATTTTVSALRTAVIVAQALADQKLVLDQITALNTTTANLIESHLARCCSDQSGKIHEQAARPPSSSRSSRPRSEHLRDDGRDRHVQARRRSTTWRRP